jgi:DNA (cytosine-5)-methyltransferase 1
MRTKLKALDLCCCAGGAGMGLYQAGFDVTGVDIKAQPRYPFAFIQADALDVRFRGFDFIWASPPCQKHTAMKHAPGAKGDANPDLIAPLRKRLKAAGVPWVMENVVGAPLRNTMTLCGSMFGLGAQGHQLQRHREFESSFPLPQLKCQHDARPVIGVYGGHSRRRAASAGGRSTKDTWIGGHKAAASEALGIDWMTLNELSEAIPPAFVKFIGEAAMTHIKQTQDVGLCV